jgi:hypothetical protein
MKGAEANNEIAVIKAFFIIVFPSFVCRFPNLLKGILTGSASNLKRAKDAHNC